MRQRTRTSRQRLFLALRIAPLIALVALNSFFATTILPTVRGQHRSLVASISPSSSNWGVFVGSSGDVHIGIKRAGIAVRVEAPREFSAGISSENDTSFIESDIRNDYYYYSVVDESKHWSYAWNGTSTGLAGRTNDTAPCFRPNFSFYDPNAPWCVEIWNYLNGSFLNFTAPKTVKLTLQAPRVAGFYNFTVFVANKTTALNNTRGAPDFTHAWNETLYVPVTMIDNPANITGWILDHRDGKPITAKGIVYALSGGQVVARTYVNQTTGQFKLTGLDPKLSPYDLQASAGMFKEPDGTIVAFSLKEAGLIGNVGTETNITLDRAPQIWGHLDYQYSPGQPVPKALTDHPWLTSAGFKVLNITVEALDALGTHIYRNLTVSHDSSTPDRFEIITGLGWRYGGVDSARNPDPYGTEFAGLPGNAQFSVYAWVPGYNLQSSQPAIVTPPGDSPTVNTGSGSNVGLIMMAGSAIKGVLSFNYCADPCTGNHPPPAPEEPIQAEQRIVGTKTQILYGGNIVIEAYDSTNTLRGIGLLNQTRADGKAVFSNFTEVPFIVFGFSEFMNRSLTWAGAYSFASGNNPSLIPLCTHQGSGSFCWKDGALPSDTYTLKVYVRGYELIPDSPPIFVGQGMLTNLSSPIRLVEGGSVRVAVASYDNQPGTNAIQAALPWRFVNLSIPVRARVYFYDSKANTLGYVERVMIAGIPNGVQTNNFKVVFAGQNWSVRDILFFGEKPNFVPSGNASISAFTFGYIQQVPGRIITPPVTLGALTATYVVLFFGNEINLTTPLFNDPSIFTNVTEHQHIVAEVSSTRFSGAVTENLTQGLPSPLDFPIFGFGGMIHAKALVGQGHFFYVPRDEIVNPRCANYGFPVADANRCFDYGFGKGTFQASVPEYGFERHFTQLSTSYPLVTFTDLFLEQSTAILLINMAKVTQTGPVYAQLCEGSAWVPEPLSWIQVLAMTAGQPVQTTTTYDGNFSLFLRGGSAYYLSFALLTFYPQQPSPPVFLGNLTWGSTTPAPYSSPLIPSRGSACGSSSGLTVPMAAVEVSGCNYCFFLSEYAKQGLYGFLAISSVVLALFGKRKRQGLARIRM